MSDLRFDVIDNCKYWYLKNKLIVIEPTDGNRPKYYFNNNQCSLDYWLKNINTNGFDFNLNLLKLSQIKTTNPLPSYKIIHDIQKRYKLNAINLCVAFMSMLNAGLSAKTSLFLLEPYGPLNSSLTDQLILLKERNENKYKELTRMIYGMSNYFRYGI